MKEEKESAEAFLKERIWRSCLMKLLGEDMFMQMAIVGAQTEEKVILCIS